MTKKIVKKKVTKKKVVKKTKKELTAFQKLIPSHQEFVRQYILHFGKGSPAYMVAYPRVKDYNVAKSAASRLLTKVNIKQAVDEEYAKVWKGRDKEVEKSKTFMMIHAIGESNIADIIDLENNTLEVKSLSEIPVEAQQAIQSITYTEKDTVNGTDRTIKVTMHSKLQALELRAKMQNMIQDKVEHSGEIIVKPAVRPDDSDKDFKEIE